MERPGVGRLVPAARQPDPGHRDLRLRARLTVPAAPRTAALDALPVREAVPALLSALDGHGTAVLCAPPGTGKTTLVPLVLAGLTGGGPRRRVLVAEPRRIAARAAARRMAWLLGEAVGGSVGFTVRGERVAGPDTVVEVVTTGVLLQRIQRDQELAGVDVVVLDECHERHLDADTAAAFLLDVRETLRPELRLVAASATTDAAGWARVLGGAPVVEAAGVSYPVETVWAPPPRAVRPPHGMRVDPAQLAHVASVVRRALAERAGDVLCFLPGVGEIARVAGQLSGADAEVLQLHGRAPAAVQEAALTACGHRRVILATSVAESSLTVPGVRVVVDSGLAREPRVDHARGLGALATVRASRAAGRQRAGRAGREAPGVVYRCWSEAEDGRLPAFPAPEIRIADLTQFALQTACWGDPDATGLALLDPPPAGAMAAAREVLQAIGALDPTGRPTPRGTHMSTLGLHPRLSRALLDATPLLGARRASELVALLSEEPPSTYGDDLTTAWHQARTSTDPYATRWRRETTRLQRLASHPSGTTATPQHRPEPHPAPPALEARGAGRSPGNPAAPDARPGPHPAPPALEARGAGRSPGDAAAPNRRPEPHQAPPAFEARGAGRSPDEGAAGLIAALAFPERVAKARADTAYLMASGTAAELAKNSPLRQTPWLAVAVADRSPHTPSARIRLAATLDEDTARTAAAHLLTATEEVRWEDGDLLARAVDRLGAIELAVRPLRTPDPALVRAALLDGLRSDGLGLLRWTPDARALRARLDFLHRTLGGAWPDVADDAALLARADDWLEPELSRARRRADLARIDAGQALNRLLPWATGEATRLDELAPERIEVPSGSRIRVDYTAEQPVLAVKLQELFGLAQTPRVAGVPVLVHLLSPAGRPAAVTADLASFWQGGYRAVRAELRGRYPKHPWPEDPATAQPTRHTSARLQRGS
ncbi:ATP-dependent helicase C-terminal domain-containing protein [Streptomyces sp. NPDC047014]|uniref:ATP-dependent RNA helicase n=1 Tax=Streptomyces sp. NPDC047014 TaxID=3155736 RepID=UPI0033FD8428